MAAPGSVQRSEEEWRAILSREQFPHSERRYDISCNSSRFLRRENLNSSLDFRSSRSTKRNPTVAASSAGAMVGISGTFAKLKKEGKVALITFIPAGYPDLSTTVEALKVLDSCGSDIIEVAVPYSDPLVDGPVIKEAVSQSLARGTTFDSVISTLKQVVPELSAPIVLFTYYNPILKRGVQNFMSILNGAGIHGLVVPDIPLEETEVLRKEALKYKIELMLLTTPTTPPSRMKAIVEASQGFVYLVSFVGVTGARASVSDRVEAALKDIKEATTKPVAVVFGISKPEHVKQMANWGADGVVVGSVLVKLLSEAKSPEEGLKELENFTRSSKSALL